MAIETPIDFSELNPRFLIWACLVMLFAGAAIYPLFITQPDTSINKSPIVTQIVYRTILVTPTPDGIKYYSNEFQSGVRKLNRPFSWVRRDVLGKQDMKVTATAYNYMILPTINVFNPTEYEYVEIMPSQPDKEFLFVFFNIYQDMDAYDDTRLWLPKEDQMGVQINNVMYYPIEFQKQARIEELENTHNMNDDSYVQHYGQYRGYSSEEEARTTAGEISVEQSYLKGGKSNAQDGYLIFEIPEGTIPEAITFKVNFFSFGWSEWRLIG